MADEYSKPPHNRKVTIHKTNNWETGYTASKKNAGGSINFLPTSCPFAKVCYFYVGKKEYSISATNKYCVGRKYFGFKILIRLAQKRYSYAVDKK